MQGVRTVPLAHNFVRLEEGGQLKLCGRVDLKAAELLEQAIDLVLVFKLELGDE